MSSKRIRLFLVILTISIVTDLCAQENWQQAFTHVKNSIGLIEYYEQIGTPESIEEKSRVKKRLTGILVDNDGLMITSSDIFKAKLEFTTSSIFSKARLPEAIMVRFPDSEPVPADFIGKDDDKGLAFIRLQNKPKQKPVSFSENSSLNLGSTILIIQHLGTPYNYALVVHERRINAVITVPYLKYLCENQSGTLANFGLVINPKGKGLGVLMPPNGQVPQITFSFHERNQQVHAEVLAYFSFKEMVVNPPLFRQKETSRKKWIGIQMQPFTRTMARYYGAADVKGVMLNTILKDSPAERGGLQIGDVVTAVNNIKIEAEQNNDLQVFRNLIREQKEETARMRIFRNGEIMEIKVELGDIPIGQFLAEEVSNSSLGFSVKELTKDIILAKQMDFDTEGVWVSRVERAGWSDIAGLMIGDLILKIDNNPVTGLEEIRSHFAQIDETQPDYVSLFIKRGVETRFLFIKTNYEK